MLGFGLAISGAITWAAYSNIRRKAFGDTILTVTGICLVAAALSIISHIAIEDTPYMTHKGFWALAFLTVGPAGGAFYLWDVALKNGNTVLLATLGYFAPIISTVLLVVFGYAEPSLRIGLASSLIALGGVISINKAKL